MNKEDSKKYCLICSQELNTKSPHSKDCGGDCWGCVRECETPQVYELENIQKRLKNIGKAVVSSSVSFEVGLKNYTTLCSLWQDLVRPSHLLLRTKNEILDKLEEIENIITQEAK